MFLDVFCESSEFSLLLLYGKEGKPAVGKRNSSKPSGFSKKLPRNLPKMRSAGCIL